MPAELPRGPSNGSEPAVHATRFRARAVAFFRSHPILCLLMLTPGIPEYLSGSSKLSGLVVAPVGFLVFLALNVGLYGPGVLLIREARVRWKVGFATVALLGAAYGILEEGIALSTMFDPASPTVGVLGSYGHWLGVNWVWIPGVLFVHVVFSIGLPIALFDLAFPALRTRSLLDPRETRIVAMILALDVTILLAITVFGLHYFMGEVILGASGAAIAVLVALARWLPADVLARRRSGLAGPPRVYGLLGLSAFPGILISESLLGALAVPAAVTFTVVVAEIAGWFYLVSRRLTPGRDDRQLVALAAGLVVPIMVFGVVSQIPYEVVLVADAAFGLFLLRLYRGAAARAGGAAHGFERVPAHVTA